nr:hypothetical protein VP388_00025 [Vibrio parahaemolyticus]
MMQEPSTDSLTSKHKACIGWVKEIHPESHRVKVDFYGNVYGQPV